MKNHSQIPTNNQQNAQQVSQNLLNIPTACKTKPLLYQQRTLDSNLKQSFPQQIPQKRMFQDRQESSQNGEFQQGQRGNLKRIKNLSNVLAVQDKIPYNDVNSQCWKEDQNLPQFSTQNQTDLLNLKDLSKNKKSQNSKKEQVILINIESSSNEHIQSPLINIDDIEGFQSSQDIQEKDCISSPQKINAKNIITNKHILSEENKDEISFTGEKKNVKLIQNKKNQGMNGDLVQRLKQKFSNILFKENELDEDAWKCDICLSKESDDEDPLSICELCSVVVHPTCYRRDLYKQDDEDDSPWYCARCNYLIHNNPSSYSGIPQCMLCPDYKGAMVDLNTKEWVHHVCVNWHNEIWFDTKDIELKQFEGHQNMDRYNLTCYICKVKQGSCIQCDFKNCTKTFHVRCGIKDNLIVSYKEMDELKLSKWEIKVFCDKHTKCGKEKIQKMNLHKFLALDKSERGCSIIEDKPTQSQKKQSSDRVLRNQSKEKEQLNTEDKFKGGRKKRQSIINEIDVDQLNDDDFNSNPTKDKTMSDKQTSDTKRVIMREQLNKEKTNFVSNMFGVDFCNDQCNTNIKAKKSKKLIMPDTTSYAYYLNENGLIEQKMPLDPRQQQNIIQQIQKNQNFNQSTNIIQSTKYQQNQLIASSRIDQFEENKNEKKEDFGQKGIGYKRQLLKIEDIKVDSKFKFKIDKSLAEILKIDYVCTYREFTVGLLQFHKVVQNFYDKPTNTFNVGLYPKFRQYFPDNSKITSKDIKLYLLREPLFV